MADVNPEARAVDEQVDRSTARDRTKRDLAKLLEPSGQSRMVGNRDLHVQHVCERTQEALGLPERKVEDHADRQGRLDGDVRIGTLTTGFPGGRCSPGVEGIIRKPDGKVASSLEPGLVFSLIPHPIPRLRVLVLAAFRVLHRWWLRHGGFASPPILDQEPCTNAAHGFGFDGLGEERF